MGGFIWHELTTEDPDAEAAFYGRLLGWEAEPFPGIEPPYLVMRAGGAAVAGIQVEKAPQPSGWIGYVHVPDVDEATRTAAASGGVAVGEPEEMEEVGRMQIMCDPDGAHFVLMTPARPEPPPAAGPGTPGLPVWDELYGADTERSFAFYADFAGWTKDTAMDMGEMGPYQMFAAGGTTIGGMMRAPEGVPRRWLTYFTTGSIASSIDLAKELGAQHIFGPQEVPGAMWIAQFLDPKGHMFGLVGPKG
ncbi:VOC family protein [Rhodobacter sp. NSM]|uniref:VOC family protein n=1 Tax=Rhodobacter sp. NSM TaxID=3457501 RepID=UPI003FD477C5